MSLWIPAEPHSESVLLKGCNLFKDAVALRFHLDFVNKIVLKRKTPQPGSGSILNSLASASYFSVPPMQRGSQLSFSGDGYRDIRKGTDDIRLLIKDLL